MRRSIATISAAVLGLALITPGAAHAASVGKDGGLSPAAKASLDAGIGVVPKAPYGARPKGPNPLLADVPDRSKVDYSGWANYMKAHAKAKAAARTKALAANAPTKAAATTPAVVVDEDEIAGTFGGNDTPADAQRGTGFGTGASQYSKIRV